MLKLWLLSMPRTLKTSVSILSLMLRCSKGIWTCSFHSPTPLKVTGVCPLVYTHIVQLVPTVGLGGPVPSLPTGFSFNSLEPWQQHAVLLILGGIFCLYHFFFLSCWIKSMNALTFEERYISMSVCCCFSSLTLKGLKIVCSFSSFMLVPLRVQDWQLKFCLCFHFLLGLEGFTVESKHGEGNRLLWHIGCET